MERKTGLDIFQPYSGVLMSKNKHVTTAIIDLNDLLTSHPVKKHIGKFILIQSDSATTLIFGLLRQYPYHANLVEQFCTMHEVPSAWEHKPDQYVIFDNEYRIRGGGYFEINPVTKQVVFSGASTAYGKYDETQLRDVVNSNSEFSGYTIEL